MDPPSDEALFVFVRLHAASGHEDKVRAAIRTVVAASRQESGCVSIDAFATVRNPQLFVVHSVWVSAAAFDRHAHLPHTVAFIDTIDPLLDVPREVIRARGIT